MLKQQIRKITPHFALHLYHKAFVFLSALYYGFPADKMIVIGVTGTKGKTSTVNFIADLLEAAGHKVGVFSTVQYRLPNKTIPNTLKMTMPGRNKLQKFLHSAQRQGCKYVVIETSSEGIAQARTTAISYDIAVFTNLSPEHIESHGSFENYKAAKEKLFAGLSRSKRKQDVKKVAVVNLDDAAATDFLKYRADMRYGFTLAGADAPQGVHLVSGADIVADEKSLEFRVALDTLRDTVKVPLPGSFHVANILAAIAVVLSQHVPWRIVKLGLTRLKPVAGRMEFVQAGQPYTIIVDYAHEPKSLEAILREAQQLTKGKVIVVTGSQGGGRDRAKRPKMGATAYAHADFVVVTNEDPYDEDPRVIIEEVAAGIEEAGGKQEQDYIMASDRREGIASALRAANAGDVVVIAGKGAEQVMAVKNNRMVPWSDRAVIEELLKKS